MLEKVEKPKTLKETALEQLRLAIMIGQLAPGKRLVERTICEQLGVSRTVVRECIRHLESEHLVTVSAGGSSVAVLESDEIRQIYHLRAMLESEAVRYCAEQVTPELVETLQNHLVQIRDNLQAGDVVKALGHSYSFYERLFMTAGMTVAWELTERLNGRIGRLRFMTLSTQERAVKGPSNLQEIVSNIAQGDSKAAVKACRKHIDEACRMGLHLNKQPS
ncbi:GntR family transcriptional regulator [Psychrobacter aquaticus]|uniref:Putative regulator PutR for proline utilization, GntR family n=1 Tax=Psychrobacter aquaticus CMS 56 TaxID=1354303 RepID=U4T8Y0_9GAMM|nr:GntR family transcriptional regulator [Psychrobacter aquaticus]ERL55169.1 putative regulator PutR for proline utilization, GntR family [Psychrobacter aquaticus CMS 56]